MVTILSFAYVEINYAKENLRENTSVFFEPWIRSKSCTYNEEIWYT